MSALVSSAARRESRSAVPGLLGTGHHVPVLFGGPSLYLQPTCQSRNEREGSLGAGPSPAQGGRCQMRGGGRGAGFARLLRFAWLPPADVSPSPSWPPTAPGRQRIVDAPSAVRELSCWLLPSVLDALSSCYSCTATGQAARSHHCTQQHVRAVQMHEATNVFDGTPSTPAVSLCYHARTARIL